MSPDPLAPRAALTQNDVAVAAGVSRSTVSRALKNDPSIPLATRERLQQLAQSMGYQPDPFVAANMLRVRRPERKRTKALLAYLTPVPLREYFREVPQREIAYLAAQKRARSQGFEVDPIPLEENGVHLTGRRYTDILRARGVQGIVIAMFENPYVRLHLKWSEFAVATHDFSLVHPKFSQAASNHYYNMHLILRQLHHLGYRRIGLAIPARADRYAQGAFSSAFCYYRDCQPRRNRIERFVPDHLKDWNQQNFRKWHALARPDAIVCLDEKPLAWLEALGLRAPDDIGIATLAWELEKESAGWSGVYQQHDLVGDAAMQLVIDQLLLNERGVPLYPKNILIDGKWVAGKTVRKQ